MTGFDLELSARDRSGDASSSAFGISPGAVEQFSRRRNEPSWLTEMRIRSLRFVETMPLPDWFGANVATLDLEDIFATEPHDTEPHDTDDARVQNGAGDGYDDNRITIEQQGIVFCDMATAVFEHPELVEEHLATLVPPNDDTFAALNASLWSRGSFIYVPPGVEAELPLQVSLDSARSGRFERTLIIAGEGSKVHYIDGCSAPVYTRDALRCAVVEIVVGSNAHVTHTTIQNWSTTVCNVVAKRARVEAGGRMRWIDGDIGSKLTRKTLGVSLVGDRASADVLSVASAGATQYQSSCAMIEHGAPNTTATIVSKAVSSGGVVEFDSPVTVAKGAVGSSSHVRAATLLLDEASAAAAAAAAATGPEISASEEYVDRDVTVSTIADEEVFYLMSRGISEEQAVGMIVGAFIEPVISSLPMEYAVEWSRLIELQMNGSIG